MLRCSLSQHLAFRLILPCWHLSMVRSRWPAVLPLRIYVWEGWCNAQKGGRSFSFLKIFLYLLQYMTCRKGDTSCHRTPFFLLKCPPILTNSSFQIVRCTFNSSWYSVRLFSTDSRSLKKVEYQLWELPLHHSCPVQLPAPFFFSNCIPGVQGPGKLRIDMKTLLSLI